MEEDKKAKREAFFKRVEEENKLPLLTIVEEELEWAEEIGDWEKGFRCPLKHHPLFCEGTVCETDVYSECIEWLKANMLLSKVRKGEILVQWRTMKMRF